MPDRNSNPGQPGSRRMFGDHGVQAGRPSDDPIRLHVDLVEAARQPQHHAGQTAVAHDDVAGRAQHLDRHVERQGGEEIG